MNGKSILASFTKNSINWYLALLFIYCGIVLDSYVFVSPCMKIDWNISDLYFLEMCFFICLSAGMEFGALSFWGFGIPSLVLVIG